MRLLVPVIVIGALTGCIIYDEELKYSDDRPTTEDDNPVTEGTDDDPTAVADPGTETPDPAVDDRPDDRPDDGTTTTDEGDATPAIPPVSIVPGAAVAGDTTIVSVVVNEGFDIDLLDVTNVSFFGPSDVGVLASWNRTAGELILTIKVPLDAAAGDNDLLLQYDDGTAVYAEDVLSVFATEGELPADTYDGALPWDCP